MDTTNKTAALATLPGTLPGLLRRGAPVRGTQSRTGPVDIVTHDPNGMHCMTVFEGLVEQANIALDLTDPAGMDIAARWLAERVWLTVGATAPTWWRMRVHPVWCLSVPNGPGSACFADDFTTDNPNGMTRGPMVHVPGISALTDPAEALAAACLAVGGAS